MLFNERLDLEEAEHWLDFFEANVPNKTDEQIEKCERMRWAINNAHKLRVVFNGMIDKVADNEVETYWVSLRAHVGEAAKPQTIH